MFTLRWNIYCLLKIETGGGDGGMGGAENFIAMSKRILRENLHSVLLMDAGIRNEGIYCQAQPSRPIPT